MQLSHPVRIRLCTAQGLLVLLLLSSSFFLSACGGNPRVQQDAASAQNHFTQLLQHAHQIGVSSSSLHEIVQQHQQLLASSPPFNLFGLFNNQATDDYYRNLATRYKQLTSQLQPIIMTALFNQLHTNAQNLIQQIHNDAQSWNNANAYYNSYDDQYYPLNAGYLDQGISSDLDAELAQASTINDLQKVITDVTNTQFDFQLFKRDYYDKTSYDQVHQTDIQALNHYHLQKGQVIVVSMVEQALRLYQDDQLVRAFQVTTGRYELPSVPGLWSVLDRESPTIFRSSEPPTSPLWYPPTPIHYAILYHEGGYFLHDAWWRYNYGPGTQFPHADASGDQSFAGNGSHGCVNIQEDQAAWLYNNTSWKTSIIIY